MEEKSKQHSTQICPFDYATSDTNTSAASEPLEEPEDSRNHGDVGGEKTKNIAQEFEARGNKLAEKAKVLLELGDAWNALKATARMDYCWESAIKLRGAPFAIESFDKALAIKPDFEFAKDDRKTALHLVKTRIQLHSTGLSSHESRFLVGDQG